MEMNISREDASVILRMAQEYSCTQIDPAQAGRLILFGYLVAVDGYLAELAPGYADIDGQRISLAFTWGGQCLVTSLQNGGADQITSPNDAPQK